MFTYTSTDGSCHFELVVQSMTYFSTGRVDFGWTVSWSWRSHPPWTLYLCPRDDTLTLSRPKDDMLEDIPGNRGWHSLRPDFFLICLGRNDVGTVAHRDVDGETQCGPLPFTSGILRIRRDVRVDPSWSNFYCCCIDRPESEDVSSILPTFCHRKMN